MLKSISRDPLAAMEHSESDDDLNLDKTKPLALTENSLLNSDQTKEVAFDKDMIKFVFIVLIFL